jgi:hypothetical protein
MRPCAAFQAPMQAVAPDGSRSGQANRGGAIV